MLSPTAFGLTGGDGDPVADLRTEIDAAGPVQGDQLGEIVTVIVELATPTTLDIPQIAEEYASGSLDAAQSLEAETYRSELVYEQDVVKEQIAGLYEDALFNYSYTNLLNGFAAQVPYGLISQIEALDGVEAVYEAQTYSIDDLDAEDGSTEIYSSEDVAQVATD
ncbi:MAG: protease inhibitor I9 family protein, partial [Bifidobacteriaceae bacterium]|nr:protease inhibitor I9 family protein [Bifidobacteriaceae bacterium]